ncbi:MAG: metallophosphoesterase [Bacteroidota bacterium]
MKIAHISDLHICINYKRNNLSRVKRLIKQISSSGIDHLVVTGDISDNSREEDFIWFRNILKENGLLHSNRTSIIIGNHDIFGGVQTAADIIDFPSKCAGVDFKDKVRNFVKYFEELFENAFSPSAKSIFPFVKEIGDVVIVGINSVDKYSKLRNPFASNGYVSKNQLSEIKKIFNLKNVAEKNKLVLIHHHFYKNNVSSRSSEHAIWSRLENFTMKLRQKKRLIKLFRENNVELVLHGHSHEIIKYNRHGINFINAGASVLGEHHQEPGYFIIDTSAAESKISFESINGTIPSISEPVLKNNLLPEFAN